MVLGFWGFGVLGFWERWMEVSGGGGRVQVTESFDEVRIASRGFGILDVGYKSNVSTQL